MPDRSSVARPSDIVEACERLRELLASTPLDAFEGDWQKQWLVQRGTEIISEASRHLNDDLRARHPEIPWRKVAGIGNVLRHSYERVSASILWTLVKTEMPSLEKICRDDLAAEQGSLS